MKIGVISNPSSRRNRKQLAAIAAHLARRDTVVHHTLQRFEDLDAVLKTLAQDGVELLVVNGGDGTLSAVMTAVWERGIFVSKPLLAVIAGGTSNTIAADVGLSGDPIRALDHLIATAVDPAKRFQRHTRALIRVSYDAKMPAVCGMFFGTAAIGDAIELRRKMFPQPWLPDPVAAGLTLAYVLFNTALGRRKLLEGKPIEMWLDDENIPRRPYALVMVTTLDKILLGGHPFWGCGDGALKITAIGAPALKLVRNAYRLLYGRDRARLDKTTYRSAAVARIVLAMDCAFNLDGEFYRAAPGETVSLSRLADVEFVR